MNFWRILIGTDTNDGQPDGDDFDPNRLIEQAQREMAETQARNRDRAVQAITQKNNLEQLVKDLERKTAVLRGKATLAENRGDAKEAGDLLREVAAYETELTKIQAAWEEARGVAETVKAAIKSEEDRIQRKTSEALLLKAQWKTMQVQRSLFASLVEVNTGAISRVPPAERAVRHALNRRYVRQAMVERNNLRQMQADADRHVQTLRHKAQFSRERGDDTLENALLREMEQHEAIFVQTRDAATQAADVVERAVSLLEEEENVLRSQGVDPHAITDDQITLYEARTALAGEEAKRAERLRRVKANRDGVIVLLLLVFAAIAFLLAYL